MVGFIDLIAVTLRGRELGFRHPPIQVGSGCGHSPQRRGISMLDPKQLDDLAQRLASVMPKGIQMLQEDINRNLRTSLEAGLAKLDLVTREEFDVQSAVLARSREKLAVMEMRITELEQALAANRGQAD
jgi:ubiquinone biosynthesis accessory factor UbiK